MEPRKRDLLRQLARVEDQAMLARLIPLLEQEIYEDGLDGSALEKALAQLFARTDDPGLGSQIKRLQNRLRAKKIMGRDPLRPPPFSAGQSTAALWDELRELEKAWQEATGQSDFRDQYEVLKKIGDGGMSRVFLARRREDGREVAVKFLRRRFFASARVVERFRRECRVCLALDHPRIVRVFAAGEHEGGGFLIMEYLPLGSADRLLDDPGFSPAMAVQVAIQTAEALRIIHDRDIVHRDLKLANLLIADYQPEHSVVAVKLTDFGICRDRQSSRLTRTGEQMGTEMYMAPEQLQNAADVDWRADLYSLGALIYRLFARKYFAVGEYTPLHKLNPVLPPTLDELVSRCLRHQPDRRPQSALAIQRDLEQIAKAKTFQPRINTDIH